MNNKIYLNDLNGKVFEIEIFNNVACVWNYRDNDYSNYFELDISEVKEFIKDVANEYDLYVENYTNFEL